jgi:hypothetical protein
MALQAVLGALGATSPWVPGKSPCGLLWGIRGRSAMSSRTRPHPWPRTHRQPPGPEGRSHPGSTLELAVHNKHACRCVSVPAPDWGSSNRVCLRPLRHRLRGRAGSTKSSSVILEEHNKGRVTGVTKTRKADQPHYSRRRSSSTRGVVVGIAFAADPERAAVERDAATLMRVAQVPSDRLAASRRLGLSRNWTRYFAHGAQARKNSLTETGRLP